MLRCCPRTPPLLVPSSLVPRPSTILRCTCSLRLRLRSLPATVSACGSASATLLSFLRRCRVLPFGWHADEGAPRTLAWLPARLLMRQRLGLRQALFVHDEVACKLPILERVHMHERRGRLTQQDASLVELQLGRAVSGQAVSGRSAGGVALVRCISRSTRRWREQTRTCPV